MLMARARQNSIRLTWVAPEQWKTPAAPERCTPITSSAALSASVGETTWSTNAFTRLPARSDSTTPTAKVRFTPGRPL